MATNENVLALKLRLARDHCLVNDDFIAPLRMDNSAVCRHGITGVQVNHVSNG